MKKALLVALFLVPFAAATSAQTHSVAHASHQAAAKQQVVRLSVDDKGGYAVTPTTVAEGVPVKMEVDLDTVKGCARTVVISAFNVKKTVKTGDSTIEFTPDKTGNVEIVCGMNMVKGALAVTEAKQ